LENGELNRQALRELVFSDTAAKNDLNAILHPLIRLEMLNQLANTQSEYCLLIAPLLYENQLEGFCNASIAVDLSEQQQLNRAMARDGSKESTIQGIMAAQISRSERLKKADYIVDNSQNLDALPEQVNDLHKKLMTKSNLHLK
jgi:dephospho-CoA kinase